MNTSHESTKTPRNARTTWRHGLVSAALALMAAHVIAACDGDGGADTDGYDASPFIDAGARDGGREDAGATPVDASRQPFDSAQETGDAGALDAGLPVVPVDGGERHDAAERADAGEPPRDAGADAHAPPDAHASELDDAGSSEPDASAGNVSCDAPRDVSEGGTFEGNTCAGDDTRRLPCGADGAPELFYAYSGSASIHASDGFVVGAVFGETCLPRSGIAFCPLGSVVTPPGGRVLFVVEKRDGGCGPFVLTVSPL